MSVALSVFYILLLSFLLSRFAWLKKAGFGKRFVVLFFLTKCIAGFAYNWIALRFLPHQGDIWPFFEDGKEMYQLFLQSPKAFINTYGQVFHYSDIDATNTDSDFIRSAFELIKLLHFVLCFFTFGSLWANTVLFNFAAVLCFFYFWRFLRSHFGESGWFNGLAFFLLPSMFFYSAGILKEGIVISLLCLLIPVSYALLRSFSSKRLVLWSLLFALLFVVKFFVAALWLVALFCWRLLEKFPTKQWLLLSACLVLGGSFFAFSRYILPAFNLPDYLSKRQQEFLDLPAGSAVYVVPLTNAGSYVRALPVAINNVLFKPLPGEGGKALYSLYAVEMAAYWLGMLVIILKCSREKPAPQLQAAAICFLLFAFLNLLFIGLIVPNIGSIIRYRSIFLPFLAITFLQFFRPTFVSKRFSEGLQQFISK